MTPDYILSKVKHNSSALGKYVNPTELSCVDCGVKVMKKDCILGLAEYVDKRHCVCGRCVALRKRAAQEKDLGYVCVGCLGWIKRKLIILGDALEVDDVRGVCPECHGKGINGNLDGLEVNDVFVGLVGLCLTDCEVRKYFMYILSQTAFHRKSILSSTLGRCRVAGAPSAYIRALDLFRNDEIATRAKKFIETYQ